MKLFQTLACPHCGASLNNHMDAILCPGCNKDLNAPVEPGTSPPVRGDDNLNAGAVKGVMAFLLGLGSFVLMFVLGEGVQIPQSVPGAAYLKDAIFFGVIGGYFLGIPYLLCRGYPKTAGTAWPVILGMNITPFLMLLITIFGERRAGPIFGMALILGATTACSWVGAALGRRNGRKHPAEG